MSIVPFIYEGTDQTVVTSQKEYNPTSDKLFINNIDETQKKSHINEESSNITYDLRVGEAYRLFQNKGPNYLDKQHINIKPKTFVEIQTVEEIGFPRTRSGSIAAKVSMLKKGIGVFPTNVDPGYQGKLVIWVYNFGDQTVKLRKEDKICALKVESILGNANLYKKSAQQLGGKEINRIEVVKSWFVHNMVILMFSLNAILVILSILNLLKP